MNQSQADSTKPAQVWTNRLIGIGHDPQRGYVVLSAQGNSAASWVSIEELSASAQREIHRRAQGEEFPLQLREWLAALPAVVQGPTVALRPGAGFEQKTRGIVSRVEVVQQPVQPRSVQ